MRVAVVTEFYRPTVGGVQEHVFHFARAARALGHAVTVVTGGIEAPGDGRDGVDVVRLGRSRPLAANGSVGRVTTGRGLRPALDDLLTARRFDLVHLHAPLAPVLPVLANRATSLPLAATHHTHFRVRLLHRLLGPLARSLAGRIDLHLAVSEACVRSLRPLVEARFEVVPNGVDTAFWREGRALASLRREGPVLLFVGRLEPRCGLERLLAAASLLPDLDPLVLVLGDGPDCPRFQVLAADRGVRTRFLGTRTDDRAGLYASADLLICPTRLASFGVTLLEGMAAGLPVVASDIDGFREVVTHDRDGLLVDTSDAAALARVVRRTLADDGLRARLVAEGRVTAARYDWSLVTMRVFEAYRSAGLS